MLDNTGIPFSQRSLLADSLLPTKGGLGTATYYSKAGQGFEVDGEDRLVRCVSGKVMMDGTTVLAAHPADDSEDEDGEGGPRTFGSVFEWVSACEASVRREPLPAAPSDFEGSDDQHEGQSSDSVECGPVPEDGESADLIQRLKQRLRSMNQKVDLSRLNTVTELRNAIKVAQLTPR